jgi:hypothetical protein
MGLRVFYPDITNFYRDVQNGRIEEPLPLDAIEGIVKGVRENTPMVFERSVEQAIEGSVVVGPSIPPPTISDSLQTEASQLVPPRDPLGELDPKKAGDFTFAGATNGLWRAFLEGEKIHKAMEGWRKTGDALRPHVQEILDWLNRFMGSGDGGPPLPPIVGV